MRYQRAHFLSDIYPTPRQRTSDFDRQLVILQKIHDDHNAVNLTRTLKRNLQGLREGA